MEEVLRDRVKYGFLATDDDDDVQSIVESEEYHEIHGLTPPDPERLSALQEAAKNYRLARVPVTFKSQRSILLKFKTRAEKEGIPYQTLLNSVMKKYAEWWLVEKEDMYTVK